MSLEALITVLVSCAALHSKTIRIYVFGEKDM